MQGLKFVILSGKCPVTVTCILFNCALTGVCKNNKINYKCKFFQLFMNILAKIMPLITQVPLPCSVIDIQTNITISPLNAKIFLKNTNLHGIMVHLRGFWDDGLPFYLFL